MVFIWICMCCFEQCCCDFFDLMLVDCLVVVIVVCWGFVDVVYFSCVFKLVFGVFFSEYCVVY